jgi:hypothetical protein
MTLEYRRVHDESSRRPVALIVVCDHCGRREVGYAWFKWSGLWWWRPYPQGLHPQRRARLVRNTAGGPRPRTLDGPVTSPVEVDLTSGPHRWATRCPRHGDLVTAEVDPATLSPATTLRVRATRSAVRYGYTSS